MNLPNQILSPIILIFVAQFASYAVLGQSSESWKHYESFVQSMATNTYIQEAWPDHMTQFQESNPAHLGIFPRFWPDYCPKVKKPAVHGTNVHNLLPSDIKLVAGIGDSLTAGNGALAKTAFGLLIQYRGRSFSMGGDGDGRGWENGDVVTFPNLLRHFSDHLEGDSIYKGSHDSEYARFNHAIPGSTAHDLKAQAETLVEHLKNSPDKVDFEKDWKVITIFVGGNDLCDYHMKPGMYEPHQFTQSLQEALDVLHKEVPRAFVNLVETIDVSVLNDLSKGFMCPLLHHFLCRYPAKDEYSEEIRGVRDGYLRGMQSLANSGRYDTRDDFIVVNQPFLRNSSYPLKEDGSPDFAFFAPDCFHFSERGHATAGTSLWNNMMQPEGKKQTSWSVGQPPECIDPNNPFIKTKVNSPKVESSESGDRAWVQTTLVDGSPRQPVGSDHMPPAVLALAANPHSAALTDAGNEDGWSSSRFPFPLLCAGLGLALVANVVVAAVLWLKNKRLQTSKREIGHGLQPEAITTSSSTADLTKCELAMDSLDAGVAIHQN